ncbi:MAG: glycosyl hydrolase [Verrucomicrobiota bacterium JB024]|nr:glycosyl hydrolase [Verrucomicrobiota bacterium JB024]
MLNVLSLLLVAMTAATASPGAAPANPNATDEARNLFYYLQGRNKTPSFVVGAFDSLINSTYPNGNNYDFIVQTFGVLPGLYSVPYYWTGAGFALDSQDVTNGKPSTSEVNSVLYSHYQAGAILLIQVNCETIIGDMLVAKGLVDAPINAGDYDDAILYIDPDSPLYDQEVGGTYWDYVRQWADAMEDLEQRGVGSYILRTNIEMNVRSFYGCTEAGRASFKNVWKHMYDYFYNVRGLNGCLLAFCPADFNFATQSAEVFYPGSQYVDILSPTFYQPGKKSYLSNYSWMIKTGKPVGFSELGVRSGDWTVALTQDPADWSEMLDTLVEEYPQITWVNTWAGVYSLIPPDANGSGNTNGDEFLYSPYTITADELPDFASYTLPAPGIVHTYPQTYYRDAPTMELPEVGEYNLTSSVAINSFSLDPGVTVTFYSDANCSGTAWAYAEDVPDAVGLGLSSAASVKVTQELAPVNLIRNAVPLDYYVSEAGAATDSQYLYERSADGDFNIDNQRVAATDELLRQLTDGVDVISNLFYRASDQQAGKCLVLIYDLGVPCEIDRVTFLGQYGAYRVGAIRLYAADDPDLLFEDVNRIDELGSGELDSTGDYVEDYSALRARYVALVITQDVSQEKIDEGRQYNMARVAELAVTGRRSLLANAVPLDYYVSGAGAVADPQNLYIRSADGDFNINNQRIAATDELLRQLTDGETDDFNLFYRASDQQAGKCLVLIYDLGGPYALNRIRFTGISGAYRVGAVRFYAGDDLDTLFENENWVDTFDDGEVDKSGIAEQALYLPTARYVALVITQDVTQAKIDEGRQYNMARVEEFEVSGRFSAVAEAVPLDYYVSEAGAATDSQNLYIRSADGDFNIDNQRIAATDELLRQLTDGVEDSFNLFYRASDQQAGKCLVLIYDLGETCELNGIRFTGISGAYRVGAVRFYAGDDLSLIFEGDNRVDAFGDSEVDTSGIAEQELYRPGARYVALVITQDVTQAKIDEGRQYNMARVAEFEVFIAR